MLCCSGYSVILGKSLLWVYCGVGHGTSMVAVLCWVNNILGIVLLRLYGCSVYIVILGMVL